MKLLLVLIVLISFSATAAQKVVCESEGHSFLISSTSTTNLLVTFKGETVKADGVLDEEEVDLVARFTSIGELTLFAKIGKVSENNYVFFQGKRFSVICR